jgi:hypothetical protein
MFRGETSWPARGLHGQELRRMVQSYIGREEKEKEKEKEENRSPLSFSFSFCAAYFPSRFLIIAYKILEISSKEK